VKNGTDVHSHGRKGTPVRGQFDLVRPIGCGGIGDREPGEGLELLNDFDGVPVRAIGADDGIDSGREVFAAFPGREEIDVLARPIQNPVRLDGIPTGQREPIAAGRPEPDLRQPLVARIHASAGKCLRRCGQLWEPGLPQ
jgi:hypothetical protein